MTVIELYGKEVDLDGVNVTPADLEAIDDILPGCQHGWIKSADGQRWTHYRKYIPPKVKAVLVYLHGIQGHSGIAHKLANGRVTNFALLSKECIGRGIAIYTPDMAGHGLSEGKRFFIPNADWRTNLDDFDMFARYAASEHNGVPLFLGGESYGANLAINLAGKWQKQQQDDKNDNEESPPAQFSGFVVNAPAIIGDLPPWPVTFALRRIVAPMFPTWVPFFMPHPVNPDAIWRDEEVRTLQTSEHYKEMNLGGCGKPFRLGTAAAMVSALEYAREVTIPSLKVPFCVCHGTEDKSVRIAGTEYLLKHSQTEDSERSFRKDEGSYHDLLGEPTAEHTIGFALDWIVERTGKGKWRLHDM